MDITMETVPVISENVKTRNEEFGLLIVSKRTPILALNKDSELIWECFDGRKNIVEIADEINSQLDGDISQIREIVKCFVESCYDLGLIDI